MAEFSAHRVTIPPGERVVIATPVDLYVSIYGDDVLNSGIEEGSPFRTPQRAIEWLSDKYISEFGFVTIHFGHGIYDLENEILLDHDQGSRVALVGAEPETLVLKYVSDYRTTGFTQNGYVKYYSGVLHGITLTCARPDTANTYASITEANYISYLHTFSGAGVVVEDFDLVYDDGYNPALYYASFPYDTRNNIARMSSILGCHKLTSAGNTTGVLGIQSSIRDDWFAIPNGGRLTQARYYGNPQAGVSYISGSCADPADRSETQTNTWLPDASLFGGNKIRAHFQSNVPVGYYGTNNTTGIPIGATSNYIGASFPNTQPGLGLTLSLSYQDLNGNVKTGWYTKFSNGTSTFLNDAILLKNNYHDHRSVDGRAGVGSSGSWASINTNTITVKLIPTVFRRFGNILRINRGGCRKIKNIFFDGKSMPCHYLMLDNISSNKAAVRADSSKLGKTVVNEPIGFGDGLFSNVGIKDFHVGVLVDKESAADLGKVIVSNCSYGVVANNGSDATTIGSVCTGMGAVGFLADNRSSMIARRCFASFAGQSIAIIRMKELASGQNPFAADSFIPGQTYATPDYRLKGTVWRWDSREKELAIAVKVGLFEAGDPIFQYH